MKTIQLQLYRITELSKEAKEKALEDFRDINTDYNWWDYVYEDFVSICKTLCLEVDKTSIYFRGFYSQGDGSSFNATGDLLQIINAVNSQAWKEYAPNVAFNFKAAPVNSRIEKLLLSQRIVSRPQINNAHRRNYVLTDLNWDYREGLSGNYSRINGELEKLEAWFASVAEKLNYFLYKSLETAYEDITSDNAVAETIEINDYWFTADGHNANRLDAIAANPETIN